MKEEQAACGVWDGTVTTLKGSYRKHCRLSTPHAGRMHKDGAHEWGEGVSASEIKQAVPAEEDIGQGEGCEGGKCVIGVKR